MKVEDARAIVDNAHRSIAPDIENRDQLVFALAVVMVGKPTYGTVADYPDVIKELLRWTGFLKWTEGKKS